MAQYNIYMATKYSSKALKQLKIVKNMLLAGIPLNQVNEVTEPLGFKTHIIVSRRPFVGFTFGGNRYEIVETA